MRLVVVRLVAAVNVEELVRVASVEGVEAVYVDEKTPIHEHALIYCSGEVQPDA